MIRRLWRRVLCATGRHEWTLCWYDHCWICRGCWAERDLVEVQQ